MKFNILNFILTHSSGLILLGSPDMERREAYRFLDGPDCGERAGVRRVCWDKHTRIYGRMLFARPAVQTGPFGPRRAPCFSKGGPVTQPVYGAVKAARGMRCVRV
jgi:hypothetical protein